MKKEVRIARTSFSCLRLRLPTKNFDLSVSATTAQSALACRCNYSDNEKKKKKKRKEKKRKVEEENAVNCSSRKSHWVFQAIDRGLFVGATHDEELVQTKKA